MHDAANRLSPVLAGGPLRAHTCCSDGCASGLPLLPPALPFAESGWGARLLAVLAGGGEGSFAALSGCGRCAALPVPSDGSLEGDCVRTWSTAAAAKRRRAMGTMLTCGVGCLPETTPDSRGCNSCCRIEPLPGPEPRRPDPEGRSCAFVEALVGRSCGSRSKGLLEFQTVLSTPLPAGRAPISCRGSISMGLDCPRSWCAAIQASTEARTGQMADSMWDGDGRPAAWRARRWPMEVESVRKGWCADVQGQRFFAVFVDVYLKRLLAVLAVYSNLEECVLRCLGCLLACVRARVRVWHGVVAYVRACVCTG